MPMSNLSREELWKIFEKLPPELQDTIFSGKTADLIGNACDKFSLPDEMTSRVAKQTGDVLLGILPLDAFQSSLAGLGLEKDTAEKISQEISHSVFYPVMKLIGKNKKSSGKKTKSAKSINPSPKNKNEDKKIIGTDIYREPIE